MAYQSTKTYGNDRGFSCAFRQWSADSHCNLIHGYSLGFKFVFEAQELDERNWVYDFGNCKWIKAWLEENFDHTLAVDIKDPTFSFRSAPRKATCLARKNVLAVSTIRYFIFTSSILILL